MVIIGICATSDWEVEVEVEVEVVISLSACQLVGELIIIFSTGVVNPYLSIGR
jgi:hypothetical protein